MQTKGAKDGGSGWTYNAKNMQIFQLEYFFQ
jgi:hypothetical protein